MATMEEILAAARTPRKPDCEYTAQESTTEGIDCWVDATVRHVNQDGVTVGLFCDEHDDADPGIIVERIDD